MDIPLGEVVHFDVITSNPSTGAVSDADSTPTFEVFEEATDTDIGVGGNLTKRTSKIGDYRGTFTASGANGFEAGKWYNVVASATVNSTAGKTVAMRFRASLAENVVGVPPVDVVDVGGVTAATSDGTATAGGAATITLQAGQSYGTNLLRGRVITITGGTGNGQSRVIASNTNASPSVVTVTPAWDTVPAADSTYRLEDATGSYAVTLADGVAHGGSTATFQFSEGIISNPAGTGLFLGGSDFGLDVVTFGTGPAIGITAPISDGILFTVGGVEFAGSLFAGITSLAQWLGLLAGKQVGNATARTEIRATGAGSGTFDETTDSQQAIRDRGDAAWTTGAGGGGGAAGSGADQVTLQFWADPPTNTVPIPDADVWVTSDAGGTLVVAGTLQTNSAGQVTFLLDAGVTYYAWLQKDGVNPILGQSFVAAAD